MNLKISLFALLPLCLFLFSCKDEEVAVGPKIWQSNLITFSKAANADWTLAANQDKITEKVIFTRQNKGQLYNYQWWQDEFGEDATFGDLFFDFWNGNNSNEDPEKAFTATGGTKGVKWAILNNTGGENWDVDFNLYGTLGNPEHFYSLKSIAVIIRALDEGKKIIRVIDDFEVETDQGVEDGTDMRALVGKKLAAWIVEEDIYFTITFTKWDEGRNNPGGAISYQRASRP